jgi:hypothetical protein
MHIHQYSRGSPLAGVQRHLRARTRPDTPSVQEWREKRAPDGGGDGRGDGPPLLPSARSSRAPDTRCGAPRLGRRGSRPPPTGAHGQAAAARRVAGVRWCSVAAWTERCGRRACRLRRTFGVPRHGEHAGRRPESLAAAAPFADGGGAYRRGALGSRPHHVAGVADGGARRRPLLADGDGLGPAGVMPLGPPSLAGLRQVSEHVGEATVVGVGRSAPDGIGGERTGARLDGGDRHPLGRAGHAQSGLEDRHA